MKIVLAFALVTALVKTCSEDPEVSITKNHIVNPYWYKLSTNYFLIEKMKLKKDSILDIRNKDFKVFANAVNISGQLEPDYSYRFEFFSDSQNRIMDDTIFFDRENRGSWFSVDTAGNRFGSETKKIGSLAENSWYRFSNLRDRQYFVYVFVDTGGKVSLFEQDNSNY